jgi:hypothetical protein
MFRTPPLGIKALEVYRALFRTQLADTLQAVRENLREWRAVHVVLAETMTTRKDITSAQMREMLTAGIKPEGAPLEPGIALETDRIPGGTLITLVPDAIRPKIAGEYAGWTYLPYLELRRRLAAFVARALKAPPVPGGSLAQALIASDAVTTVLAGSGSHTSAPDFARTVASLVSKWGRVTFFDSVFGYETPAETFLGQAERFFNMPGRKSDMLYFDAHGDWYAAFHRRGELRVGRLLQK